MIDKTPQQLEEFAAMFNAYDKLIQQSKKLRREINKKYGTRGIESHNRHKIKYYDSRVKPRTEAVPYTCAVCGCMVSQNASFDDVDGLLCSDCESNGKRCVCGRGRVIGETEYLRCRDCYLGIDTATEKKRCIGEEDVRTSTWEIW